MFKKSLAALISAGGLVLLVGLAIAAAPSGCDEPHCTHPSLTAAQQAACEDRVAEVDRQIVPNDSGVPIRMGPTAIPMPPPTGYAPCGEVWDSQFIMQPQVTLGMSKLVDEQTPMLVSLPDWAGGNGLALHPKWNAPHKSSDYDYCTNPNLLRNKFKQSSITMRYDLANWPDPWDTVGNWNQDILGDLLPTRTYLNWVLGDILAGNGGYNRPNTGCLEFVHNFTMFAERGRIFGGGAWHEYWTANRAAYWLSTQVVPGPEAGVQYHMALEAVDPYVSGAVGRADQPGANRNVFGEIELPDGNGGVRVPTVALSCYSRLEWGNVHQVYINLSNGCQAGFCQ